MWYFYELVESIIFQSAIYPLPAYNVRDMVSNREIVYLTVSQNKTIVMGNLHKFKSNGKIVLQNFLSPRKKMFCLRGNIHVGFGPVCNIHMFLCYTFLFSTLSNLFLNKISWNFIYGMIMVLSRTILCFSQILNPRWLLLL